MAIFLVMKGNLDTVFNVLIRIQHPSEEFFPMVVNLLNQLKKKNLVWKILILNILTLVVHKCFTITGLLPVEIKLLKPILQVQEPLRILNVLIKVLRKDM